MNHLTTSFELLIFENKKIDVTLGDEFLDKYLKFELVSFDLEVEEKLFHSNSNSLTQSMIYWISHTKSKSIKIKNDLVTFSTVTRYIYGEKVFQLDK